MKSKRNLDCFRNFVYHKPNGDKTNQGWGNGNSYSDSYTAKLYAKEIMDQLNIRTAILVSNPLHMKRAMLMAKDAGIEAYSSPTPTSRYVGMKSKLGFLGREVFFISDINYTDFFEMNIVQKLKQKLKIENC